MKKTILTPAAMRINSEANNARIRAITFKVKPAVAGQVRLTGLMHASFRQTKLDTEKAMGRHKGGVAR